MYEFQNSRPSAAWAIFGLIGMLMIVLGLIMAGTTCDVLTSGPTHDRVVSQATAHLDALFPEENGHHQFTCLSADTDNNGYVTCTARVPPDQHTYSFECASLTRSYVNWGCRQVVPRLGSAQ